MKQTILFLAFAVAVCGSSPAAESTAPQLRVGLARVCITPQEPLWLHGYASKPRFRPFEGKLNDLYAKAMAIEDARGERAVLITIDLCTLRAAEAKALFGRLTESSSGKLPARSWCWVEYAAGMMTPEVLDLVMARFRLARGR